MKTALGFDCHTLLEKDNSYITIAGVKIPADYTVEAWSDGDVVYHAIADAILSATLHKSIGELFSDKDEKNKGRDSSDFVKEAWNMSGNVKISNIDIIVILQEPIISPYAYQMRKNISALLNMNIDDVSIRGKRREDSIKKISAMLTLNIC